MIKLNISVCRKVSDANYGSNGASVALEIELDNSVFADREQLRAAIQDLQLECDAAVEEQLARGDGNPAPPAAPLPAPAPAPQRNVGGNGNGNGRVLPPRPQSAPPRPRNNNGGGPPGATVTPRQLLGWASKHTKESCGFDMTRSLGDWGKNEGYGFKISEWSEAVVAEAYAIGVGWLEQPVS